MTFFFIFPYKMKPLNIQKIEARSDCDRTLIELESIHQSLPSNNDVKKNVANAIQSAKQTCNMELYEGLNSNWGALIDMKRYIREMKNYLRAKSVGGKRKTRNRRHRRSTTRKH